MLESEVSKIITGYLDAKRLLHFRANSGKWQDARTGSWIQGMEAGTADLFVGYPLNGVIAFGFCEVKSPVGKLRPEQIVFLRRVHKLGCLWVVADELDDVQKWLADNAFHGKTKYVSDVLDEDKRFVSTIQRSGKKPMPISMISQFEMWQRKKL